MATKEDELRQLAAEKPTYAGTYEGQLADLYDRIANREDFSYDVNADPLYQQYKDKYKTQGKLAMKDTMGQAAALTGGYGSTYGQQVGQQTYDAYLQNLSDAIPTLYQTAYGKYRDKGNDMVQQYGLLGQQRDAEYGQFRDALSDWNYDQEVAYSRQQQSYSNLYALIKASGYSPTDAELQAAGMTREAANALIAEFRRQTTPIITGGSGGSGGGGGGGSRGGGGNGSSQKSGSNASAPLGAGAVAASAAGLQGILNSTTGQVASAVQNGANYVEIANAIGEQYGNGQLSKDQASQAIELAQQLVYQRENGTKKQYGQGGR